MTWAYADGPYLHWLAAVSDVRAVCGFGLRWFQEWSADVEGMAGRSECAACRERVGA